MELSEVYLYWFTVTGEACICESASEWVPQIYVY
jgi:hypothetical protein